MELVTQTAAFFETSFDRKPDHIFLSPGRINIIGEHIDYNHGYVLPAAIDKYVCLAVCRRSDSKCVILAKDIDEKHEFSLDDEIQPVDQMWANYFLGVLSQLVERELNLTGFDLAFSSTIPIGAGLSSSAAVECGFCFAMNEIYDLRLSKKEIALIGQKAEHTFVGVMCGIMDQFANMFGKENQVIKLDCVTLEYDYHNADFKDYSLLLLDSNVKHENLTSGYNDRRREVENGFLVVSDNFSEVKSWRDCTIEHLNAVQSELGNAYKRCLFVVSEIKRVLDAVDAIEKSDFHQLGKLMFETHDGLSNQYEVSCAETDFLVDLVKDDPNVIGSRMMGGGFGGCTINLVKKGHEEKLIDRVSSEYFYKFSVALKPYQVNISNGTSTYRL